MKYSTRVANVMAVTVMAITLVSYLRNMEFIDREKELESLSRIRELSQQRSMMTFIVGRRRIGKTRLIREAVKGTKFLYFFVSRKEERLLCEEFIEIVRNEMGLEIFGEITQFKDLFALLMSKAKKEQFTLIIDEFQEFLGINPSVFSDMQNVLDSKKQETRMNLILCGSIYSMMQRIFEDSKEPLFGRADERLTIGPFSVDVLNEIMTKYHPGHLALDLLSFYIFTGGVPKYVELFVDKNCLNHSTMLDEILRPGSLFLEEGRNVLIEEFGKNYGIYFSILALIASGKTSRSQIESVIQKEVGGYLERLENEYHIIDKVRPIFSKPGSRNVNFFIRDNFLNFWFRFIYKYRGAIEIGNPAYIRQIIERDFNTYSGYFLEKYFREKLALTGEYAMIGSYWEKGNTNEIDIVAVNPAQKKALIGEVKLKAQNISIPLLKEKAGTLLKNLGGYQITYKGFSLEDL